jgi:hypothetical protein
MSNQQQTENLCQSDEFSLEEDVECEVKETCSPRRQRSPRRQEQSSPRRQRSSRTEGCVETICPEEGCVETVCLEEGCGESVCPREEGCVETVCPREEGCAETVCPKEEGCAESVCPKEEGCGETVCPKEECTETVCPKEETPTETKKSSPNIDLSSLFSSLGPILGSTPEKKKEPEPEKKSCSSFTDMMSTLGPFIPMLISLLSSSTTGGSSKKSGCESGDLHKMYQSLWDGLDRIQNKSARAIVFMTRLSKFNSSAFDLLMKHSSLSNSSSNGSVWSTEGLKLTCEKFESEVNNVVEQLSN